MSYIATLALLKAVQAALVALPLDPAGDPAGTKLFDLVAFYNAKEPKKALQELFATQEKTCCFLVPGGDNYENAGGRDTVSVLSHRETDFSLLLCDRGFEPAEQAALLGGDNNVGVLTLKDRAIAALLGKSLGLAGVVLLPGEGGLLDLFDPRGGDEARTCWDQSFTTYAGREKIATE